MCDNQLNICYTVEERRRLRANDPEYNRQFGYVVRQCPSCRPH